ncbi:TPA: DUF4236 domain-containing protein [Clostridioides difficile]|uniref:DUF4236 domain-containing protein n=1 Tax=Clostridioides difficile TaxID=1496 RepID=UPI000D64F3F4|nr:DUF4236 domain-containing protein [Clostridioides difficile]VFD48926.1 putative phage-like protein [Clostridioides difficile]HBE8785387.1 DUF4236 domain-containing protein [Clostridioides difficile]HBF2442849.1 DUF4236 domain-containing protein [Clostridioides difficile]HBF2843615.1 DUF4236 domain-containing protein [Clostridioides difficile]HBF3097872.1 DUF4236 domain-containing protein [Clostridioides difficile]
MGFKFRKSIKLGGGLKLNINKNSVSVSGGVKGARVSVNSKGKATTTLGVPGSGLYYQETTQLGGGKKKNGKSAGGSESSRQAQQLLKIINDCANIVNTTKDPKTFFYRYNMLLDKSYALVAIEDNLNFSGQSPSQMLDSIIAKKTDTINDFLTRYYNEMSSKLKELKTEKARMNNAYKFSSLAIDYKEHLNNDNKTKLNRLYKQLLNDVKKQD